MPYTEIRLHMLSATRLGSASRMKGLIGAFKGQAVTNQETKKLSVSGSVRIKPSCGLPAQDL